MITDYTNGKSPPTARWLDGTEFDPRTATFSKRCKVVVPDPTPSVHDFYADWADNTRRFDGKVLKVFVADDSSEHVSCFRDGWHIHLVDPDTNGQLPIPFTWLEPVPDAVTDTPALRAEPKFVSSSGDPAKMLYRLGKHDYVGGGLWEESWLVAVVNGLRADLRQATIRHNIDMNKCVADMAGRHDAKVNQLQQRLAGSVQRTTQLKIELRDAQRSLDTELDHRSRVVSSLFKNLKDAQGEVRVVRGLVDLERFNLDTVTRQRDEYRRLYESRRTATQRLVELASSATLATGRGVKQLACGMGRAAKAVALAPFRATRAVACKTGAFAKRQWHGSWLNDMVVPPSFLSRPAKIGFAAVGLAIYLFAMSVIPAMVGLAIWAGSKEHYQWRHERDANAIQVPEAPNANNPRERAWIRERATEARKAKATEQQLESVGQTVVRLPSGW